jgi:hypothetical protein
MNFQKILLVLATVTLITMLVVIGITLSKAKSNVQWPPIVGECPDYWVDLKGDGEACFNSHSLGKCNIPRKGNDATMNFNQTPFTGSNGTCSKYTWATSCGVTWDGITSGVQNPCDTTTTTTTNTSTTS